MIFIKYFHYLVLFILVFLQGESICQQSEKNYLGVNFGGSDYHIQDEHVSQMIFSSIGIAPSMQYFYRGENNRHYAEVAFYYDYLGASSSNFNADNYRGRIRYTYLHSVIDFEMLKNNCELYLGGSLESFLSHTDYYYLYINQATAIANESWYWSNSLDLSAQLEFNPFEREFLSFSLYVPIITNVSRPTYSPSGNYNYIENDWKFMPPWNDGEIKFFTENFSLNFNIVYQRPIAGNFNLNLSYEFYYSTYNEPADVSMYMNSLSAGLFFCF